MSRVSCPGLGCCATSLGVANRGLCQHPQSCSPCVLQSLSVEEETWRWERLREAQWVQLRCSGRGVTDLHSWQQRCNSFFLLKETEVSEILQHQQELRVLRGGSRSARPPPRSQPDPHTRGQGRAPPALRCWAPAFTNSCFTPKLSGA